MILYLNVGDRLYDSTIEKVGIINSNYSKVIIMKLWMVNLDYELDEKVNNLTDTHRTTRVWQPMRCNVGTTNLLHV